MRSHDFAKILLDNPDVELIMQRDPEGNGYSPMAGIDYDVVMVKGGWECDVYNLNWDADEADMDPEEWEEVKKNNTGYAVIWPKH